MASTTLPDYLTNPSAVLQDTAKWRYGKAPDYSNTRSVYEKTKTVTHEAGSLAELVQNLVKNWEIEASFKMDNKDWRTIDHANHTFAVNGQPPITAEQFLKLGTYNATISPNQYYSPEHSDFASSHKTFKGMMPTFVWEVVEVYSGPPQVSFKWRHWGVMKNDYIGFNDKGEKVTAKAHGGPIVITGITIATVDEQVRMQKVETWFDPMDMFRQISPKGIITREPRDPIKPVVPASQPQKETQSVSEATDLRPNTNPLDEIKSGSQVTDSNPDTISQEETKNGGQVKDEKSSTELPQPQEAICISCKNDSQAGDSKSNLKPSQSQEEIKDGTQVTDSKPTGKPSSTTSSDSDKNTNEVTMENLKKMLEDFTVAFDRLAGAKHGDQMSTAAASSAESSWVGVGSENGGGSEGKGEGSEVPEVPVPTAVAVPEGEEETRAVHEEMSRIAVSECPFMNKE